MKVIVDFLVGSLNENWFLRGVRTAGLFALAAAAQAAYNYIVVQGGFEVPAGYEWVVPVLGSLLVGADKFLRDQTSKA